MLRALAQDVCNPTLAVCTDGKGDGHVDLYDRVGLIPFDKLTD